MPDNLILQDAQVLIQRVNQLEHDVKNLQLSVSMLTELITKEGSD